MHFARPSLVTVCCTLLLVSSSPARAALSNEQEHCLSRAKRFERHGWTYLHIEGEPRERGFQHGYLLAPEIAEGLRDTRAGWEHDSAMPWSWLVEHTAALFTNRIDPENLAEMAGIAEGMQAAGQPTTLNEIIAYNGYIEISEYWWPQELKKIKDAPTPAVRESCSAFIATGSMTRDGNVVLGHNTMMDYSSPFPNVIEDILPAKGHRILWQTQPGWIHSGMDFFITDAGLVGAETTIGSYEGFDTNGLPEFTRMRRATQDANSVDQWSDIMRKGNNGGYANAWLVGDIHTREIARLELGLHQVGFDRKRDGYFTGSNIAEDRKLLVFETTSKETDIRQSSVARRVRWKQLMKQYAGRIDLAAAKQFEADHYDSYHQRTEPGGRSLCGHFEMDPDGFGSWPGAPYACTGTVDGKVVDAAMAAKMSFAARWGSACGRAFDAKQFLTAHPQFDFLEGCLKNRPSQPWADFRAGE